MNNTIVLDLETARAFDEVVGRDPGLLGVTLVGLYRYDTNQYETYDENQMSELNELLKTVDIMVGFNIIYFDIPALQPHVSHDLKKITPIDLLADIKKELGFRLPLDSIAQATLGIGKSGDGLKAIQYYKEKRWEELKSYCLDDVKITKEIYEYGLKYQFFKYWSKDRTKILEAKSTWEDHRKMKLSNNEPEQPTLF